MVTWFGNLKTVTKLMIGFAFTGAIMAGLAGVGLTTAGVMRDNIENVNNMQLKPLMEITELRGLVHQVRSWVIQAVLTRDSADRQQALTKIEEIKTKTDELRKRLEKSIVSPQVRKGYEEFVVALSEYRAVREGQVLKLVRDGKQDEALGVMKGEGARKYKAVVESINNLVAIKQQIAQDRYEHSLDTFLNARNVLIVSCVGGIVLSLLFGWLVARLVARNLANVLVAAQALGGGNLSARSSVMTQDEIGTLANAFNQMGEALQKASREQQSMMQQAKTQAAEIKGITDAIGKAQAVIEFTLDGTVITANDNFLKTLDYTLDDVKGRHHRLFCDPTYINSPAYSGFWKKLNRGEFDIGLYRWIGKEGKEVWIQATYTPILDMNGKPSKVMKFATDVTREKNAAAEFEGKLSAINKAQGAVEFALDGTVITANDNFLKMLEYTLDDVKGQHHRLFCDPSYASSPEHTALWQTLNCGEFDAGQYRRIGKGGKEIWLQASYNPIMNANGKVYKVVTFATDITPQKTAQQELEACMAEAQQSLGALAHGDLTQPVQGTYQGELAKITTSINSALTNLTQTIHAVRTAVESVTVESEHITKGSEDLSKRTSEQASALEETSTSMAHMTSTVKQSADSAKQANQLAIAARNTADKGGAVTQRAVEAMCEINKSSKKIADIITVIDEIAFQTNLLALNAAVEAARAGEQGRGFAVVAAEVRNLAQRSATAAKEIKGLINESIQRVADGGELVNQSGKTLEEIVNSVKHVTDIIAEISAASQEQASGIDQVNKAVLLMDDMTQKNSVLVEKTTSAAHSMKVQARELKQQMEAFKIKPLDSQPVSHSAIKPAIHSNGSNAAAKRPVREARHAASDEIKNLAVVTAGNGMNYRAKEAEFEEF